MSLLIDIVKKAQGKDIGKVDYVTKDYRLDKCRDCEHLKSGLMGFHCGKCGCPVEDKTSYKDEECPIGKWRKEL